MSEVYVLVGLFMRYSYAWPICINQLIMDMSTTFQEQKYSFNNFLIDLRCKKKNNSEVGTVLGSKFY